MAIKAIIFDYDGVIVDSFPTVFAIYKSICKQLNKKCPENIEEFRKVYGRTSRVLLRNLGFTPEEVLKADAIFSKEVHDQKPATFPKIAEAIKKLSKNYKLFVVTANMTTEASAKLGALGVLDCFVKVIGRDGPGGPMRKVPPMIELLKQQELAGDEVVLVGDRVNDFEDAQKVGIKHVVLAEYGWGFNPSEISAGVKFAKTPMEIVTAVEKFNSLA